MNSRDWAMRADRSVRRGLLLGTLLGWFAVGVVQGQGPSPDHEFRDPRAGRLVGLLQAAKDRVHRGQVIDGLDRLQIILDQPGDTFYSVPGSSSASLKRRVDLFFHSMSPEVTAAYERRFGSDAARLLRDARQTGDTERLIEVIRRYFFTRAGFDAADEVATRFLDRGWYQLSAPLWLRMVTAPAHKQRLTTAVLLKSQLTFGRVEWSDHAKSVSQLIKQRQLKYAGQDRSLEAWQDLQSLQTTWNVDNDWRQAFGNRQHNPNRQASTPHLRPLWALKYERDPQSEVAVAMREWEDDQRTNSEPLAVANYAIAVGDNVLVRDSRQIKAVNSLTGRVRWSYRSADSHASVFREVVQASGSNYAASKTGRPFVDTVRAYIGNAAYGMLSSDGQYVFFIDATDLKRYRPGNQFDTAGSNGRRHTNRLVAVDVAHPRRLTGGRVEPQWTLGGRPRVPYWHERDDENRDAFVTAGEFHGGANMFRRLDENADGQIDVEEARGDGQTPDGLAGHLFLGPPLAAAGMLYVVTAFQNQLNVACVVAQSGQLVWLQGIGVLRGPSMRNIVLGMLVCTPALADGVLVCPTQSEVLVGVDPVTGGLLWSYDQSDVDQATRNAGFRAPSRVPYGHLGFPGLPLIDSGRVVCLPRHSRWVHCVDLATGERCWRVPRDSPHQTGFSGNGDEYVATIADGRVLLVGGLNCRCLSLADGREIWSSFIGTPSGRGVRSGEHYLLPLQDGRVVTLDLQTGGKIGFSLPNSGLAISRWSHPGQNRSAATLPFGWQPGNLMLCGQQLISVGPSLVVAFPQALDALHDLNQRLTGSEDPAEDVAAAAELELALGRRRPARQRLEQALKYELNWQQRRHVQSLLREVLHLELVAGGEHVDQSLKRLRELSVVPRERARYLFRASELYLRRQNEGKFVGAIDELLQLSTTAMWEHPDDVNLRRSQQGWLPSVMQRASRGFQSPAADRLATTLDRRLQSALSAKSVATLDTHLKLTALLPQSSRARLALAQRLKDQGRYQQAEFLLMQEAKQADAASSGPAIARLVQLWDAVGLRGEAARLIERLQTDYAQIPVGDHATGSTFAELPTHSEQLRWAVAQRNAVDWPVRRVGIFQRTWYENDPALHDAFVGIRSSKFPLPSANEFLVFDKGTDQQPRLAIINKLAGRVVGEVEIPPRLTPALSPQQKPVGHFFTAVSRTLGDNNERASILGISLLDPLANKPLWKQTVDPDGGTLRAGPAGPGYAVFQVADRLMVVDPVDGQPLWERKNLPVNGGLVSDPYSGIFGDEHVLVLFDSNRTDCTVYDTMSGAVLNKTKLNSGRRIVFGRRLFYEHRDQGQKRFRIWDPLAGKTELDLAVFEPQVGRSFCTATDVERHLAMIVEPCTLLIRDMSRGRNVLSVPLNPAQLQGLVSNGLSVFSDRERWFVAFRFEDRFLAFPTSAKEPRRAAPMNSGFQRFTPVNGELRAFDRRSGRELWNRRFAARSFLHTPFCRLPFLVSLARLTDRRQTRAMIAEIVDAQTGQTLGYHESLAPDKFLHVDFQPTQGLIELQGMYSRVRIDFSHAFQRWQLSNP